MTSCKLNSGAGRLYTLSEAFRIYYNGVKTAGYYFRATKKGEISASFSERIMLAVTEVNGCAMCSFAHTRMALEAGLTSEEIRRMLTGAWEDVPEDELPGVLFAQHYADARGLPSSKSWKELLRIYGAEKSAAILGAVRLIMIGNLLGIPLGSLIGRFKKASDPRSSLHYEISTLLSSLVLFPVAACAGMIARIFSSRVSHE